MVKVKNISNQIVPLVIPNVSGSDQVNLRPRQSISLAIKEPTQQMKRLKHKGFLRIK